MNFFYKITAAVFAVAVLFSCNQKESENKEENIISSLTLIKKEIEVTFVGEVISRTSYTMLQSPEFENKSEKEIDKYLEEEGNSNPVIIESSDSNILSYLTKAGLVKEGEFIMNNFKGSKNESFEYTGSAGKRYKLKLIRSKTRSTAKLVIYTSTDSVLVDTKRFFFPEFKFAIMDIIPGGNKELVLLDEYHISNGDNSDLVIYEIKTK